MQALQDDVVFPIFQILFFLLFLIALYQDWLRIWVLRLKAKLKGWQVGVPELKQRLPNKVQDQLSNQFVFGTSVFILAIITTTKAWSGYKTIITILDLVILLYLSYISPWYRRNALRLIHWLQTRFE